jgi:hypothetical protein
LDYSDFEDDTDNFLAKSKDMGTSDLQLAMQLELARQNSLVQHGKRVAPLQMDFPIKSTIYEGSHLVLVLIVTETYPHSRRSAVPGPPDVEGIRRNKHSPFDDS